MAALYPIGVLLWDSTHPPSRTPLPKVRPCRRFAENSTQKKGGIFLPSLGRRQCRLYHQGPWGPSRRYPDHSELPLPWCRLERVACSPRFETPRASSTTKDYDIVHTPSPGSSPARRSPKTVALTFGWARCRGHRSNSSLCNSSQVWFEFGGWRSGAGIYCPTLTDH